MGKIAAATSLILVVALNLGGCSGPVKEGDISSQRPEMPLPSSAKAGDNSSQRPAAPPTPAAAPRRPDGKEVMKVDKEGNMPLPPPPTPAPPPQRPTPKP